MGNGEPNEAAPSRRGLVAAIAIGLVVVLLLVVRAVTSTEVDGGGDDEAAANRPDDTSTTDPPPPTSSTTTTSTTAPPPPPLPGVTAQGAVDGLAGSGWTCSVATGMYPDHVQHHCEDPYDQAWADLVATHAGEILYVSVSGYEEHIGAFEEVASLGWTGVDGGEVADWIGSTVANATAIGSQDARFGEVTFTLIGDPASPVGSWGLRFGRQP